MEARWEFKDQDFTLDLILTGDYPVAFVEILSSGNKFSRTALEGFLDKIFGAHSSPADLTCC